MAKISARGATELARRKDTIEFEAGRLDNEPVTIDYTHVLRSDRAILRKTSLDSGYRIVGKIPQNIGCDLVTFFNRYVERFVAARS